MCTVAISANTSWYIYNFRKNTIRALINEGYRVVAISPYDEYSKKIEGLGAEFINVHIDQGGTNPIKDIKTLLSFRTIYSRGDIDVVLNFTPKNNIYSTVASLGYQIKVINSVAGLGSLFINGGVKCRIARLLYGFSQKFAHKVFFQNDDDRSLFVDSKFVSVEKTERLPGSGVDLSRFVLTEAPDDSIVRFILVARMLYEKGVVHYVEAAKKLKDIYGNKVEFKLLGFLDVNNPSAITTFEMEKWVAEGAVNYLGISDQVEDEIAKVDCVVLPSYYREGVPKSLLEAGAMGKPIITTDNIGCRETVDDGINGFLCKPQSTDSLFNALKKIISMSHEERINMGQRSRKKIEIEFDERIIIDRYISTIETLSLKKSG
ncbi:glycosyl transferase family 1 [Chania multitudinisentens RB-25]|uniref:Glycosyl transferase family 1 n=2 Tax=Chania TaxID=1745211 RepID=W0LDN7_9GAMM|nr:glycosyltransferase family 4 protein [Chania multitudinisentens]AHG21851.1 glycosyl transferase family 1 [Chania multitudinisentens RB-25]